MTQDTISYLKSLLINKNNKFNARASNLNWWKHRNIFHLYEETFQITSFLNESATIQERVYCLINNIKEIPKCIICRNPTKFTNTRNGKTYQPSCSSKCGNSKENISRREKIKNTNIKKYGGPTPSSSQEIRDKIKKTYIEKYGYYCNFQSEEFKQKRKEKDKERRKKFTKEFLYNEHIINKKTHVVIADENNVSAGFIDKLCREYSINTNNYCKKSLDESKLAEFIKSVYSKEILENKRNIIKNKELDIFLPEDNIAIEYNGLYWHSYNRKETSEERNDHCNKKNQCEEKNIKLIQIFEHEWKKKQDICKSIICAKLRIFENSIYARECDIKEISNKETKYFLEQNHIQGNVYSKINLGLFFKDELISIMTFSKPRFTKFYEYELTRYCCKQNTQIVGGANKLFAFFKKIYIPKSIISYADMRFSNGELYNKLGFIFLRKSKPNYYYYKVNNWKLYSRNHFQKHKLSKLLSVFDSNLTESQNMFNNGYRRIWDCGNLVYAYIA